MQGEPAVFLGSGVKQWVDRLHDQGAVGLTRPAIHFTVRSYLRHGNAFDLDNLASVVLKAIAARPESIWATLIEGSESGVSITESDPPQAPASAQSIRVSQPRSRSDKKAPPMEEFADLSVIGSALDDLGVFLAFDAADVHLATLEFNSPIKALIDGMGNVLGPGRFGPADHRIKDLRVTRGSDPLGHGVRIQIWTRSTTETNGR